LNWWIDQNNPFQQVPIIRTIKEKPVGKIARIILTPQIRRIREQTKPQIQHIPWCRDHALDRLVKTCRTLVSSDLKKERDGGNNIESLLSSANTSTDKEELSYFWTPTVFFRPGDRIEILKYRIKKRPARGEWRSVIGRWCSTLFQQSCQLSSWKSRVLSRIEAESCQPTSTPADQLLSATRNVFTEASSIFPPEIYMELQKLASLVRVVQRWQATKSGSGGLRADRELKYCVVSVQSEWIAQYNDRSIQRRRPTSFYYLTWTIYSYLNSKSAKSGKPILLFPPSSLEPLTKPLFSSNSKLNTWSWMEPSSPRRTCSLSPSPCTAC